MSTDDAGILLRDHRRRLGTLSSAEPWHATEPASNWGAIDDTLFLTLVITGLFFVAIGLFVALALWRYRHRDGLRAHYEPENKRLEWWLIGITSVGIVGLLAPGLVIYNDFVRVPDDARVTEAVGQQWQWAFRFPGEDGKLGTSGIQWIGAANPLGINPGDPDGQDDIVVQGNELRLPVGRPVKLLLRSKDVLHNFYVPQLRAKMDLVPGMVSHFWFTPTETGRYEILCAEFCGVGHYSMRGRLLVEETSDFDRWLGEQPTFAALQSAQAQGRPADPLVERGRELARRHGCTACHSLDGSDSLGPGWRGLYGSRERLVDGSEVLVDEAYLRESILDPAARIVEGYSPVMTAYALDDDSLKALLALIRSLGEQPDRAAMAEEGRMLAESLGCRGCHSIDGSAGTGPGWQGLYGSRENLSDGTAVRVDEAYLRESILEPNARIVQGYSPMMPAYDLNEAQLAALVAYIGELGDPAAGR
ncbi:c-type cytochrome [Marinobacterium aestuariivivens]|uniref:cytochrome-c oxidase n=1 Tax=Marinobacterium aestuariivivens TaxID=1698799 RepID=A0ABW1ZXK0_9GAMM